MPEFVLHLLLGIIGGNIGGLMMRNLNLGFVGNSLSGILGGIMCGEILSTTLTITPQISALPQSLLGSIIGGVFGGVLLMSLLGIIKTSLSQA